MHWFLIAALTMMLATPAFAQQSEDGVSPTGLLPPYTQNAYGPGINADATGRPFTYQPRPGFQSNPQTPILGQVKRDAYGPGVHMDQFGRPVRDAPLNGLKR